DESDASAGDGVCASAGDGSCTLRAAIQEANSISQDQGVNIDFSVTGTIILTSQLPSIQHDYISILGPGGDNIIVNFNNLDNGFGIDNSSYVTISGLTIEGAIHSGIYFSAFDSDEVGNNISSDNIILNGTGINLNGNGYSTGVVVSNNIINNNQYRGIDLYQASGNNLTLNTISGSNQGIYFDNSSSNEIDQNTISDNNEYGIDFRNSSMENIITSNTISDNSRDGIYLNNSNENIINSNNTISDNLRNGIYLDQSDDNTIEENTISSNISCGISLSNIKGSQIKTNIISSNLQNGICLNDASNNTISSNNISGHGAVAEGYWLAGVSTMKYGDVVYDAIGMNFGGGAITIPTILYAADFENNISLVSANSNTITNFIEAAGAAAGGFDFGLIHVGDISVPLTAALPHGMIPNLATLELALGEGATAEALLQNVLTKSGDTWIYNGITNGVNGVVVETDGDPVTLASTTEPSLVHSAYGPYSGIVLDGTSSSNTLNTNIFTDNANGISFAGSADSNTVTGGSINSGIYNAITDTTDKTNTLNNVTFDRSKVQRTSGILIILPADEVIPVVPPAPAIPHHTTSGSYIAGHNPFVSTPTSSVPPTDCLPGYLYSPSTGKACGTTSAPTTPKFTFTKNLKYLQIDNEVKELQKFLNTHGYQVSTTGAGSLGNETTKFGSLTQKALIKFQLANKISPAVGYFGPITRALVNSLNN
ncbi:MAG TPA: right-handed parallel beta-helix repeat-containing protein, partial [Candidatus Paceibacterota bacterium]|nr:right-handed parallel beta-helix repeat-containing protein [Candidatus Paceibacterota bacterium]